MKPDTFAKKAKALGLHRPSCGPDAVRDLMALIEAGRVVAPKVTQENRHNAPTRFRCMGQLIRAKLAAFDPGSRSYAATAEGKEWLAQLQKHKLT